MSIARKINNFRKAESKLHDESLNIKKSIEEICKSIGGNANILMMSIENHRDSFNGPLNKRLTASALRNSMLNFKNSLQMLKCFPDEKVKDYAEKMIDRIKQIYSLMFVSDKITSAFTYEKAKRVFYQNFHLPTQELLKSLELDKQEMQEMATAIERIKQKYE